MGRKLGLIAVAALAVSLVAAAPAAQARKKVVTKTYEVGVGAPNGGLAIPIPDGAGQATQLARSVIHVKGLNPRGKIKHVNFGVLFFFTFAKATEIYLASPRGVINLSHDVGGDGNNYGAGPASCAGRSRRSTATRRPGSTRPGFRLRLRVLRPDRASTANGLGDKKSTNAAWSLLVEDDDSAHPSGTLACWYLQIKTTNPNK